MIFILVQTVWVRKEGSVRIMLASEIAQRVKSKVENRFKGVIQEVINEALARQKESVMAMLETFKDQTKDGMQESTPSSSGAASTDNEILLVDGSAFSSSSLSGSPSASPEKEILLVDGSASPSSSSSKSNVSAHDEDVEKKEVSGESAETPRSVPSGPAASA